MRMAVKNTEKTKDHDLLLHYRETGKLEILGELYNRYIHLVYGVCLKYLENREESKDGVNRIFEILITEIPKFDIKNFRGWLFVVAKNYCLMEIRKRKAEKRRIEKYSEHYLMESTDLLHPIDNAPGIEIENGLKECIEQLKQEQQQCIRMFYYEELCYREIADTLEIAQNKVKSYIQNGKRNLKICMEQFKKENEV